MCEQNEKLKLYEQIIEQARTAAEEVLTMSGIKAGQIVVVGCSTSEILGERMGTSSVPEIGKAVFDAINSVFKSAGVFLAAQCCEHLNRAIIIEEEASRGLEAVNAVPRPKAGGSFATAAYKAFEHPVAVEEIHADAGLDIGGTLIGMHLKKVAVPVRLSIDHIGCAILLAARTRPKYIGGERAHYDERLG